ncbi:MAG: YdeI/OmpD-associated family protein [Bacteroidota bacterium]
MGNRNPKFDAYISRAPQFAQPILSHLREVVHQGCPEVKETIKWGFPHFEYKGILCSMAAFKQYCAFGFWKGSIMSDPKKVMTQVGRTSMGHFDRITSLSDLPLDKILISYIKEAMKLNDEEIKVPQRTRPKSDKILKVPAYFLKKLKRNKAALKTFEGFSYSNKKDYVEWIEEAKTESTREKRMVTAMEWMAEGKIRNWKYVRK